MTHISNPPSNYPPLWKVGHHFSFIDNDYFSYIANSHIGAGTTGFYNNKSLFTSHTISPELNFSHDYSPRAFSFGTNLGYEQYTSSAIEPRDQPPLQFTIYSKKRPLDESEYIAPETVKEGKLRGIRYGGTPRTRVSKDGTSIRVPKVNIGLQSSAYSSNNLTLEVGHSLETNSIVGEYAFSTATGISPYSNFKVTVDGNMGHNEQRLNFHRRTFTKRFNLGSKYLYNYKETTNEDGEVVYKQAFPIAKTIPIQIYHYKDGEARSVFSGKTPEEMSRPPLETGRKTNNFLELTYGSGEFYDKVKSQTTDYYQYRLLANFKHYDATYFHHRPGKKIDAVLAVSAGDFVLNNTHKPYISSSISMAHPQEKLSYALKAGYRFDGGFETSMSGSKLLWEGKKNTHLVLTAQASVHGNVKDKVVFPVAQASLDYDIPQKGKRPGIRLSGYIGVKPDNAPFSIKDNPFSDKELDLIQVSDTAPEAGSPVLPQGFSAGVKASISFGERF